MLKRSVRSSNNSNLNQKGNKEYQLYFFVFVAAFLGASFGSQAFTIADVAFVPDVDSSQFDLTPSFTSNGQDYPPLECNQFLVQTFPNLTEIVKRGISPDSKDGGHWTPCTGLVEYGFSYHTVFGRFLSFVLKPKTVLEFGCGYGQQSDYLARFIPGGSDVTCIEPEAMFEEVFQRRQFPHRPRQLAVNIFDAQAKDCFEALKFIKRDLVVSTEVAEHVASKFQLDLAEFLAKITGKYLVFSGARPGQQGHGHIEESMVEKEVWRKRFEMHGLKFSERYTFLAKNSAWGQREYDIQGNLIVMLAPGVPDLGSEEIPEGYDFVDFDHVYIGGGHPNRKETRQHRSDMMEWTAELLWPEFYSVIKSIAKSNLCGEMGALKDFN